MSLYGAVSGTKGRDPVSPTKQKLGLDPCRKFRTSLQLQSKQESCDQHNPEIFDYSKSLYDHYLNNNSKNDMARSVRHSNCQMY